MWYRGGRLFAESQGQAKFYRRLLCEGDSQKQLTMMKALIQEGGKDVIFNIDPNQSPDAKPSPTCGKGQSLLRDPVEQAG